MLVTPGTEWLCEVSFIIFCWDDGLSVSLNHKPAPAQGSGTRQDVVGVSISLQTHSCRASVFMIVAYDVIEQGRRHAFSWVTVLSAVKPSSIAC